MSLKYEQDVPIKFDVLRLFFSKNVAYFLPLFISFFEYHN